MPPRSLTPRTAALATATESCALYADVPVGAIWPSLIGSPGRPSAVLPPPPLSSSPPQAASTRAPAARAQSSLVERMFLLVRDELPAARGASGGGGSQTPACSSDTVVGL